MPPPIVPPQPPITPAHLRTPTECGQCVASEVHECRGDQEQEQDLILQSEEQEQDVILQSEYNDTATPTTTQPPTLVGEGVG